MLYEVITVNKAELIMKIADLVNDKKIEGISNVNDESDREGMRIVFDLKRDAVITSYSIHYTKLYEIHNLKMHGRLMWLGLVPDSYTDSKSHHNSSLVDAIKR